MAATSSGNSPKMPVTFFPQQMQWLEQERERTGESKSTIIRRAVRRLMEEEETAQLKRDLTIKAILGGQD